MRKCLNRFTGSLESEAALISPIHQLNERSHLTIPDPLSLFRVPFEQRSNVHRLLGTEWKDAVLFTRLESSEISDRLFVTSQDEV